MVVLPEARELEEEVGLSLLVGLSISRAYIHSSMITGSLVVRIFHEPAPQLERFGSQPGLPQCITMYQAIVFQMV